MQDKPDGNLKSKRDSTDLARDDFRVATEQQTDSLLATDRTAADSASLVSRGEADTARILGQQTVEESLRFERLRADRTTAEERRRADLAFSHERGDRKKVEGDLLTTERNRADLELLSSAGVLQVERTAHLATKAALTTREELMAIVSHDLRNPLGAISMCAAMLLGDPPHQKLDDDAKTWIAFMKRNADTGLRLVEDLLDMERISNGQLELRRDTCDLAAVVAEAVQNFSALAAAKSILLRVVPTKPPPVITCDRDRILQVVTNLLGNAVKFTPDGGQVDVRVESGANEGARVTVSDNGPGIPVDRIDGIFERFSQLGTKDRRGLGLGLYISKTIAEAHHGSLRVDSQVGIGSNFTLSLPLSPDH